MATPKEPLPKIDQSVRYPVDMSPEAVTDRMRRCSELSVLCMKLKQAGKAMRESAAVDYSPPTQTPSGN